MTNIEDGSIVFEIAKRDPLIATFFSVHKLIGQNIIDACGDYEQRARLLPEKMNMKNACFGLIQSNYVSDATGLQTTAKKVEGVYLVSGRKKWIGNAL